MVNISTPIQIGKMHLPHRYYFAPAGTCTATKDGEVTARAIANIETIAKGMEGGLVTWALFYVNRLGRAFTSLFSIEHDDHIIGMGKAVERVHLTGAKVAPMIFHGGALCKSWSTGSGYSVSSSRMNSFFDASAEIRELTPKQVTEVIKQYAAAALRCKKADADAIYLHACHGSLIQQFHSPYLNKRKDKWGKDRTLFGKTIIEEIKSTVGSDFPLIARISIDEFMGEGQGYDVEYGVETLVPEYVSAGIDAICISAGRLGAASGERGIPSIYRPYGVNLELAARVKEKVRGIRDIPVMHAGKFFDHKLCEQVIAKERVDMIGLCRPVIADTQVVRKRLHGLFDEERKCICCGLCTTTIGFTENVPSKCSVNSQYCREIENRDVPANVKKKVLVIGGGPAGMEAARILAKRGHAVDLFEKEGSLGGLAEVGASVPKLNTSSLRHINKYLVPQMKHPSINVHLNTEVTRDMITGFMNRKTYDSIIVATGSRPEIPEIPGIRKPIVILYDDYLRDHRNIRLGDTVVVIGAQEGAEIAASLGREGKTVYLVDETNSMADTPYLHDWLRKIVLFEYLGAENIKRYPETKVVEVQDDGVILASREGNTTTLKADHVILAFGRVKNSELYDDFKKKIPSLYLVGDARKPHSIGEAVHTAGWAARDI